MKNLKYSQDEIKVFKKSLNTVLDDLIELWNVGVLSKLSFPVTLPGFSDCDENYTYNNWYFMMEEKGFYLYQENSESQRSYWFTYGNKRGKFKKLLDIREQDIIFLNNYPKIREVIVSEIQLASQKKNINLDMARELAQKLTKEATIEIDLPDTLNQHIIEVKEEDGKKIGTLNFGGCALKIITNASIEFKSKISESPKVKRK